MKQTLAFIIAVMMFAGAFTVSATEPPLLTVAEYNITQAYVVLKMECGIEYADGRAALRVFDKSKAQTMENLVWADETRVSATGVVSLTVDMESFKTAEYVFIVAAEGISGTRSVELAFYDTNEKKSLWESIQKAQKELDTATIKNIIKSRSEYLGLDKKTYDELSEKETTFLNNLLSCSFSSIDDFVKKFDINLAMTEFIGAEEVDVKLLTEYFIKLLEMEDTPAAKAYVKSESLSERVTEEFIKNASALTSDNFKRMFDTIIILSELSENSDLNSSYEQKLRLYDNEIGIDFSKFDALKNQARVLNSMTDKTENGDFTTLIDIAETFNQLVKDAKEESSRNDKPQGGGAFRGNEAVVKPPLTPTPETIKKLSFNDISGVSWAYEAINYLVERGIVNGRSEEVFAPNDFITRAEAVKLIVTAFNITSDNTEDVFEDVKNDAWYYSYVMAAYQNGIVSGLNENTFAPDVPISRQDFVVMMSRMVKDSSKYSQINFSDNSQIASYAKDAVALLVSRGVINGTEDNRFAPLDNTTRAQAAKILFNMIRTEV